LPAPGKRPWRRAGSKRREFDPLADRDARRATAKAEATLAVTSRACAEKHVAAYEPSWRNPKSSEQWTASLRDYALPMIGDMSVSAIETGHVAKILEPIWATKTETASRVRGRIEAILDYAKTHGWRSGENPARSKEHHENVFAAPARVKRNRPPRRRRLASNGTLHVAARRPGRYGAPGAPLRCADRCRTNEVLGAGWAEIGMAARILTIPEGMRTKNKLELRGRSEAGRRRRIRIPD
jgi:hypothetical protein